jgi:excisionase family DNA binding protein
MMPTKLVLSIAEAAEVLRLSDDLIYELTARGELVGVDGQGGLAPLP